MVIPAAVIPAAVILREPSPYVILREPSPYVILREPSPLCHPEGALATEGSACLSRRTADPSLRSG